MNRRLANTIRSALSLLLTLLLLVQALAPAGYMPASLDRGWLVMLCPEGMPAGFLSASSEHSGHLLHGNAHLHGQHAATAESSLSDENHHGSTDYCALGSALDAPALTTYVDPIINRLPPPAYGQIAYSTPLLQQQLRLPQPRAPPRV